MKSKKKFFAHFVGMRRRMRVVRGPYLIKSKKSFAPIPIQGKKVPAHPPSLRLVHVPFKLVLSPKKMRLDILVEKKTWPIDQCGALIVFEF